MSAWCLYTKYKQYYRDSNISVNSRSSHKRNQNLLCEDLPLLGNSRNFICNCLMILLSTKYWHTYRQTDRQTKTKAKRNRTFSKEIIITAYSQSKASTGRTARYSSRTRHSGFIFIIICCSLVTTGDQSNAGYTSVPVNLANSRSWSRRRFFPAFFPALLLLQSFSDSRDLHRYEPRLLVRNWKKTTTSASVPQARRQTRNVFHGMVIFWRNRRDVRRPLLLSWSQTAIFIPVEATSHQSGHRPVRGPCGRAVCG